jgi:hypothetical protein
MHNDNGFVFTRFFHDGTKALVMMLKREGTGSDKSHI